MLHEQTGLVSVGLPKGASETKVNESARTPSEPRKATSEMIRRCAWEIGERRAHVEYRCPESYVNLIPVSPSEAFVVWRVQSAWIGEFARRKGDLWNGSRSVVRLYDVSFIHFNGFNAHRMRDIPIEQPDGERLLPLPLAGTTQIAEVGFLLRNGEFVPAARSTAAAFPPTSVSPQHDCAALYVDDRLTPEAVASPWEGATFLRDRSRPKLRKQLRIAMLSFEAEAVGCHGSAATFVTSLAAALRADGQQVHVFVPAGEQLRSEVELAGVHYHPLQLGSADVPVKTALAFARSLEARLMNLPSFDFFHMQDWMTAMVPWLGTRPAMVALTSLECTRRNGSPATDVSREIEKLEREIAHSAECLLVPEWLRERALASLCVDDACVHAFPMDGRPPDEWEVPFDHGKAKADIGLHPLDRMLLFVGPIDHGAGPDLVVDALPTVLSRTPNVRIVFVGCGRMHGQIVSRAQQLGVGHAVRLLGHVELPSLVPLLRASEALLMPSRYRVEQDEAVVGLARRAGRAVLTTHAGPSHTVRHEQDGLVVYDNPPSLVWGLSRLLEDARHTEEMGKSGIQRGEGASWSGVAHCYAELCAKVFHELT